MVSSEPTTVPGEPVECSVVVPLYNEESVVRKLHEALSAVMQRQGLAYELILVNDGSNDGTGKVLEELARADEHVLFVDLRRNFGQTTALQAGLDHARGDIIITMDGDMQHDPHEIPLFLEELAKGYDIVSGWRSRRRDNFFLRRVPSRTANWLLMKVSGVQLHDFGTTFKAYRRAVLEGVHLYGEMHRFVPALSPGWGRASPRSPSRIRAAAAAAATTAWAALSASPWMCLCCAS